MKTTQKKQTVKLFTIGMLLMILFLGIFLQGCQKENDMPIDIPTDISLADMNPTERANIIAFVYLEIKDDQLLLRLPEQKAMSLGMSKVEYDRIQTEIIQANAFIMEAKQKGHVIVGPDLEKVQTGDLIRTRSGAESGGGNDGGWTSLCSFQMSSLGGGGSCSGFVPSTAKELRISASMVCFIGTGGGNVYCGGQVIPYSFWGFSGGSTTVKLPLSNTTVTVSCNTVCSSGGSINVSYR